MRSTPHRFAARDGFPLEGDLFLPDGEPRGTALVAGAMGVRRRFYAGFAAYLAEAGLLTLTLDYRGVGNPRAAGACRLRDWAEQDLTAAAGELAARAPGVPLAWVGHSAGGQLMGLVDAPVRAALFVASQSGYWRHWSGLGRAGMFLLWHAAIPGLVRLTGRLPMRALGQGDDVPAGVALEWAEWGRHPLYVGGYAASAGGAFFPRHGGPIRSYAIADDGYAPRAAVEALLELYTGAGKELRVLRAADVGASAIGHFGAFRERFRDTFWREARGWLLERLA